jgi:aminopeptidase N
MWRLEEAVKRISLLVWGALLLVGSVANGEPPAVVHHILSVELNPGERRLDVVDAMRLGDRVRPDATGGYRFVLHAGLAPEVLTSGWRLERVEGRVESDFFGLNATTETIERGAPLEGWRLIPVGEGAGLEIRLRYSGVIHHELATSGEEYQRSFSETAGIIDDRGVFLAGASFWIPTFGDGLVTFELEVRQLDLGWEAVSQGRRILHETGRDGLKSVSWHLDLPTEEVYLVAGPWHSWADRAGGVDVFVFLREDDPALANKYLQATKRYLKLYEGMLTAFPYASFALVENFWETGYGMPGFTLLGPRIIRFPWILTSSYPHELLHNWWGNSAYVDFDRGNWCEGLTAYMADHLFAEQRGEGSTYRRATLKKYTDFVTSGSDFPLDQFRSRRSAASEAVGYGKSLMLFHMVRRAIGDELFLDAMRHFYDRSRFTRAAFADLAMSFETTAGGDWGTYIDTWTGREGAPGIEIVDVAASENPAGEAEFELRLRLRQTQTEDPFPITVPIAVTVEGVDEALWFESGSCLRECEVVIPCPGRPLRADVDPAFDVMRRLDPLEVPPALSTIFGSPDPLFVLPSQSSIAELDAWRELAAAWARPGEPRLVLDSDLDDLPAHTAWVLGWRNLLADKVVERLAAHPVDIGDGQMRFGEQDLPRADHSVVLVARGESDPATAVGWVAADPVAAIPGLTRKLPHYTRYSYLGFRGSEPDNVAKGMWQPVTSPLVRNISDGELVPLRLPERAPLAELPPAFDAEALLRTVQVLADEDLEGRGPGSLGLADAVAWVETRLSDQGLEAVGDTGFRQSWSWTGGEPEREIELTNLIARLPGTDPALRDEPVLVLAHIDHLGRGWPDVRSGNTGRIHPGADDNASGVAVLIELASVMAAEPRRPRPVVFGVVTAEEAGRVGSRRLMDDVFPDSRPFACLNLDTVGRLAEGKLYVLNADSAREWRFIFMGVGYTTGAPISVVSEPLDSSDQMSCIERGVPAVQLFTGPHGDYHRPTDTSDLIDADGMAVVAEAAHEAVAYLAERREPLTVTIGSTASQTDAGRPGGEPRRASLGTMPDFGFDGPGVRVQQVMPASAAEEAGIQVGDIVVTIDDQDIIDLRSYSAILKSYAPGDEIAVTVIRDGERLPFKATLSER